VYLFKNTAYLLNLVNFLHILAFSCQKIMFYNTKYTIFASVFMVLVFKVMKS